MAENLLTKLLEKIGVKSVAELRHEERETFERYEKVLQKKELTLADVRQFLETQISIIEGRWRDNSLSQAAKGELVPYHTCYRTLLSALDAPALERQQLENVLLGMINAPK